MISMQYYIELCNRAEALRLETYQIEKQLTEFENKSNLPKQHRQQYIIKSDKNEQNNIAV